MFEDILNKIKESKNILIMLHVTPDGDCVGASTTMEILCENLGKKAKIISEDKIPDYLKRALDIGHIEDDVDYREFKFNEYDLILVPDIAIPGLVSRKKSFNLPKNTYRIRIDHHPDQEDWCDIDFVDSSASSTSALLYKLLKEHDLVTAEMLPYISYGIITDTGTFKNSNTTAEDFEIMAEAVRNGVDISETLRKALFKDFEELRYRTILFKNLKHSHDGKVVYSSICAEDISEAGFELDNNYSLNPSELSYVNGAEVALLVNQKVLMSDPVFTFSLRSINKEIDVAAFAEKLGGGGHKNAAGGRLTNCKDINEAIDKILEAIEL